MDVQFVSIDSIVENLLNLLRLKIGIQAMMQKLIAQLFIRKALS